MRTIAASRRPTPGSDSSWLRRSSVAIGAGHLAVLTADEDDGATGNRVLTVVIHPASGIT
jgi:hypothetical protein